MLLFIMLNSEIGLCCDWNMKCISVICHLIASHLNRRVNCCYIQIMNYNNIKARVRRQQDKP